MHYFSTLSKREAEGLYDFYKFDFDAFGYDHKELLAAAKLITNGTEDANRQGSENNKIRREDNP